MIIITKTSGQAFLHYTEDFDIVWPNASIAIVGPNGSGKTTAARALMWSFIGRFPTPPNISKWTMDLPRPGRFVGIKKSPDTVVKTNFNVINADGELTGYTITRQLTWDKKMSLVLESNDGVVKLTDKTAQNQIFLFAGVSHGASVDECSKLFIRKHWFGVDQDTSIFTASATQRRELLESTNPMALLPRLDDETAVLFRAENKLRGELAKGLSSSLGSVSHIWTKIKGSPMDTGASGELLSQADLDQNAIASLAKSTNAVRDVMATVVTQQNSSAYSRAAASSFLGTVPIINPPKDQTTLPIHDHNSFAELGDYLKDYQEAVLTYQTLDRDLASLQARAAQSLKDVEATEAQISILHSAMTAVQSAASQLLVQIESLAPFMKHIQPSTVELKAMTVSEVQTALAGLNTRLNAIERPRLLASRDVASRDVASRDVAAADLDKDISHISSLARQALVEETSILNICRQLDQLEALQLEGLSETLISLGFTPQASDLYEEGHLSQVMAAPMLCKEFSSLAKPDSEQIDHMLTKVKESMDQHRAGTLAAEELAAEIGTIGTDLHTIKLDIKKLLDKQQKMTSREEGSICEECGSVTDPDHIHAKTTIMVEELASNRAVEAQLTSLLEGLHGQLSTIKQDQATLQSDLHKTQARLAALSTGRDVYESQRATLVRKLTVSASSVFGASSFQREAQARIASHDLALGRFATNVAQTILALGIPLSRPTLERFLLSQDSDEEFSLSACPAVSKVVSSVANDLGDLATYIRQINGTLTPSDKWLIQMSQDEAGRAAFIGQVEKFTNASLASQLNISEATMVSHLSSAAVHAERLIELTATQSALVTRFAQSAEELATGAFKATADSAHKASEALMALGVPFPESSLSVAGLYDLTTKTSQDCQAIVRLHTESDQVLAHAADILRYLNEANDYAVIASEKTRKIEALENLKSLLSPNGVARTMVLSSVASQAFDDANKSIKKLDLEKDLHVSVEVVSLAKDDQPPQPALDIIFTVEGQRANLPSNSQGLQVSLALDLAVQSQGGWSGFFIVDEPEQGLDSQTRGKINAWLRGLGRQVIILTNFATDNFDQIISTDEIVKPKA